MSTARKMGLQKMSTARKIGNHENANVEAVVPKPQDFVPKTEPARTNLIAMVAMIAMIAMKMKKKKRSLVAARRNSRNKMLSLQDSEES